MTRGCTGTGISPCCCFYDIALGTQFDVDDPGLLLDDCDCGLGFQPVYFYLWSLGATVCCVNDPNRDDGTVGLGITDVAADSQSVGSDGNFHASAECCIGAWGGIGTVEVISVAHTCGGMMHSRLQTFDCNGDPFWVQVFGTLS
jgi:hypothetical protein